MMACGFPQTTTASLQQGTIDIRDAALRSQGLGAFVGVAQSLEDGEESLVDLSVKIRYRGFERLKSFFDTGILVIYCCPGELGTHLKVHAVVNVQTREVNGSQIHHTSGNFVLSVYFDLADLLDSDAVMRLGSVRAWQLPVVSISTFSLSLKSVKCPRKTTFRHAKRLSRCISRHASRSSLFWSWYVILAIYLPKERAWTIWWYQIRRFLYSNSKHRQLGRASILYHEVEGAHCPFLISQYQRWRFANVNKRVDICA